MTFRYISRAICAVFMIFLVSCVDNSYRIDEVSTEVTIATEKTTLPIGYLERKSIGDLLAEQTIKGLTKDENGNYSFEVSSEGETLKFDKITTEFTIPEISSSFDVDYPEFDFEMAALEISETKTIAVAGMEDFNFGDGEYELPSYITLPTISGSYDKVFEGENLHLNIAVPEQVQNINKVIFRSTENGHNGAPMHVKVALNGLAGINGGGKLDFDFKVEGAELKIVDDKHNVVCNGSEYKGSYEIAAGVEYIDFVLYVESLTNTAALDSNHHLDIPLKLSYDMNFKIDAKAGKFSLGELPSVELSAKFEYADAEVCVNSDVNLVEYSVSDDAASQITIAGLPSELKSVNRVSMKQNDGAILTFFAQGLGWLGDIAENLEVMVTLPEYLKLHKVAGQAYEYDEAAHQITTTIARLDEGVAIAIEALDFGALGLSPNENGDISLQFAPSIVARFKDDSNINVSGLMHDGNIAINVGISEANLSIESLSGKVDYSYELSKEFKIKGLDDVDLEIGALGIKPVIELALTHPLTLQTVLNGSVTPCVDGVAQEQNAVKFSNVALDAAEYVSGAIIPAEIILVIADESLRANYADSKYTFVGCDVTKLLCGSLPDSFNVELSLGVDASSVQTLYLADNMSITYSYGIDIPLSIDDTFNLSYKDSISGLSSLFGDIAEYDVKVGDVALIATVLNTTPLELVADVVLKNKNGEITEAQVRLPEGTKIVGSKDGVTPAESVVRFELVLGEDGRIPSVADVDIVEFELVASSAAENGSVALNEDQYIEVKFQLELDGGITVDPLQL